MKTNNYCDGITRRDFVRIGGLSAMGLGLGSFFGLQSAAAAQKLSTEAKAKSCILIWLEGGPSQIETFDPKPDAPSEVRGPLAAIGTNVSGIQLPECLERTAQVMDKIALIRSMTSPLGEHKLASEYLMTGYIPTPAVDYPNMGSTVANVLKQTGVLPPFITTTGGDRRQSTLGPGYLPTSTAPFEVGADFKVRDLDFYQGLDLGRIDRRRQFVNAVDQFSRAKDASASSESDPNLERAYNMIASVEAKRAFDLTEEPRVVHERYGTIVKRANGRGGQPGGGGVGKGCLLARRLVERGVPFVTVNSTGWDSHENLRLLKERNPGDLSAQLPSLDMALSALITDLSDRGMLDETLVVVMGEFGRTPKINSKGGRDHWPSVFSVAMAGGGVQGGQIIGSSDSLGELPANNPITPPDLSATIFKLLGINPEAELHTSDGRPIRIAPDGARVIAELMV